MESQTTKLLTLLWSILDYVFYQWHWIINTVQIYSIKAEKQGCFNVLLVIYKSMHHVGEWHVPHDVNVTYLAARLAKCWMLHRLRKCPEPKLRKQTPAPAPPQMTGSAALLTVVQCFFFILCRLCFHEHNHTHMLSCSGMSHKLWIKVGPSSFISYIFELISAIRDDYNYTLHDLF